VAETAIRIDPEGSQPHRAGKVIEREP
jgi:hypothetical protein